MRKKFKLVLFFPLVFLLTLLVFNLPAVALEKPQFIGFDIFKPLFLDKTLKIDQEQQKSLVQDKEDQGAAPAEPVITGVEDGKIYGGEVSVFWKEVVGVTTSATLNGSSYIKNKKITQEGKYVLVVTAEKQGLKTKKTIRFSIDKQPPPAIKVRGIEDGYTYRKAAATWGNLKGTIITATLSKNEKKEEPYIRGEEVTENGNYLLKVTTTKITNGLQKEHKIRFTIDNEAPILPKIIGVVDGGVYTRVITPTWYSSEGTTVKATLNNKEYKKGTPILADGIYQLTVTASLNKHEPVTSKTINFAIDTTAPQVIAPAQVVARDKEVYLASSEGSGFVYIIQEDIRVKTVEDLEAAVEEKKGAKAPVKTEREYIAISTCKLLPGTYYAYVVDGTCHLSEKGQNEIKIAGKSELLPNRHASSVELDKDEALANGKDGGLLTIYLYNEHGQPYLKSAWVYAASDRHQSDEIEGVDKETVCVQRKGSTAILSNNGVVKMRIKSQKPGEARIAAGFNEKVYDFIINDPQVDEKTADIIEGNYGRKKIDFFAE